jgi:hypothetical protein
MHNDSYYVCWHLVTIIIGIYRFKEGITHILQGIRKMSYVTGLVKNL